VTSKEAAALDERLDHFLADVTAPLGRSECHHWAKIYLQGLLLEGVRKSIEPLAERMGGADVQSLRQFVGQSPWAVDQIQKQLAEKVVDLLAEPEVWMFDETALASSCDARQPGVCLFTHRTGPRKKTAGAKPMPATLPQTRARLQVRLIHLAGQCPRCKSHFKNSS